MTIGPYGVFTVERARDEAREQLRSMRKGNDPREAKRAAKASQVTLRTVTALGPATPLLGLAVDRRSCVTHRLHRSHYPLCVAVIVRSSLICDYARLSTEGCDAVADPRVQLVLVLDAFVATVLAPAPPFEGSLMPSADSQPAERPSC